MVLGGSPRIVDYARGGISNWRDFLATAAVVRSMLGISPSAWEEAQTVMGEVQAAIVVACILQRGTAINSAGGYLRGLTRKAQAGEFSLGPILMAQINSRLREKRRARRGGEPGAPVGGRCNRDRVVLRLTARDQTRPSRSLWQEQV